MQTSALVHFTLCSEPRIVRPAVVLEQDEKTGRATLRIFTLPRDMEHFYADEILECRKGFVDRKDIDRGTGTGQWHE